ncbi:MAG: c-type cytochrome [Acidobacteria bacterium]|nr:c-type cytochrome [Acidobacteriota bacterium]
MKKMWMVAGGVAVLASALMIAACSEPNAQAASGPDASTVARGQYLVTIGGCNDCHTPLKMGPKGPEPDMSRMLSGHPEQAVVAAPVKPPSDQWMMVTNITGTAHSGPWGVSFTANLTPDENTGLGIWTEDMFIKAMRTGRHMGASREILPPMPWFNYGKMSDEDLKAVYAYLRTIPPVHNRVPDPLPPAGAPTATN